MSDQDDHYEHDAPEWLAQEETSAYDASPDEDYRSDGEKVHSLVAASDTLPERIYLLPIHNRPFFPAQVQPLVINRERWEETIRRVGNTPHLALDQRQWPDDASIHAWMKGYSHGFMALSGKHGTALVGGDVTSGSLAISVTVMGEVPTGQALTRSGARPGDIIAVTGALGGGAGGLHLWQQGERDLAHPLLERYLLPTPRLAAGQALRGLASAALDISDGLLADLGHLRRASGVGAQLEMDALPLAEGLMETLGVSSARQAALSGGDDYELLVSVPPEHWIAAQSALAELHIPLTPIGRCIDTAGVHGVMSERQDGWQHFVGETP